MLSDINKNENVSKLLKLQRAKYSNGWRWCARCAKWYHTEEVLCRNCSTRLRIKSKRYNRVKYTRY